jgi:thiol-disulfide isomerase/thioredoxin
MPEPPTGGSGASSFGKDTMVLWSAVILVGALCLLDLALSVGIVRRLRDQTADIAALRSSGPSPADSLMPPGSTIGPFAATTTTDEPVAIDGPTVVGLFLTGCGPCQALLPSFIEYARRSSLPVLAVVTGDPDAAEPIVESLLPVADVVLDGQSGPLATAFQATSFPQVYVVDGGRVVVSGRDVSALPAREALSAS